MLLNDVEREIAAGNDIPADFKARLAAVEFPNRSLCELLAKRRLVEHPELLELCPQDPESVIAYLTAKSVRMFLHLPDPIPFSKKLKVACEQQAIPNRDAVDKITRYEAAAERSLARALDRLERLQRRRMAKAVPSPLNANVSSS